MGATMGKAFMSIKEITAKGLTALKMKTSVLIKNIKMKGKWKNGENICRYNPRILKSYYKAIREKINGTRNLNKRGFTRKIQTSKCMKRC